SCGAALGQGPVLGLEALEFGGGRLQGQPSFGVCDLQYFCIGGRCRLGGNLSHFVHLLFKFGERSSAYSQRYAQTTEKMMLSHLWPSNSYSKCDPCPATVKGISPEVDAESGLGNSCNSADRSGS